MIITKQEFKDFGFECEPCDESRLEGCIKRAEYVLTALCRGTIASAMAQSESNAFLIKQAAAFEADALLKAELSDGLKRVSLGDLSYEAGTGGSQGTENGDIPETVKKLLCAAGCFFGTRAAEVIE